MKHKELLALAKEAGKSIKGEADLTEFRQMLTKVTIEAALNAELDDHLENTEENTSNSRNGYSRKRLQTEDGEVEIENPVIVPVILNHNG